MPNEMLAKTLNDTLPSMPLAERIKAIAEQFAAPVFTTSLGKEDQVLTALVAAHGASISTTTLQTGRLFAETLALIETTEHRFGLSIARFEPDPGDVDAYVAAYGLNGFYDSVKARKACCDVRKIRPLARALAGADAWVTGLRRAQSTNRTDTPFAEFDTARNLIKLNPLADVSDVALEELIAQHHVPVNPLHARGFPSIGCDPCTRAIKPGEHERAGRWWWEQGSSQECGLHADKHATRSPQDTVPNQTALHPTEALADA